MIRFVILRHRSWRRSKSNTTSCFIRSKSSCVDTLIIGGGVMGCSTAYNLARSRGNDGRSIIVVERDPTYQRASSCLSAGGIRQQFSVTENIQMGLYGRDFLRNAATHLSLLDDSTTYSATAVNVHFQEHGYLFLTNTNEGAQKMKTSYEKQKSLGCNDLELLLPNQLEHKFGSWLNVNKNNDDIVLGSFSKSGEGWIDPWIFLKAMKDKAAEMGVTFVHGTVVGATQVASSTNSNCERITSIHVKTHNDSITTYPINNVVNAAGPQAAKVLDILAGTNKNYLPLPVRQRKRCIFYFHCSSPSSTVPPIDAPLTIDAATNVYFRPEGGANSFICGVSPPSSYGDPDHDTDDALDLVQHELFNDIIWPVLYQRIPAFGEIKVKSSWAGYYDYNTVDQNAIIGHHPSFENLVLINGFSGHGLMQSPAAGKAVAELLDNEGKFLTLDLSIFSFDRLLPGGTPVLEDGII